MSARSLIAKARVTNNRRDAGERAAGFAAPGDGPSDGLLRTAILAVVAGLETGDLNAVAEAHCMLDDLHKRLTGQGFDGLQTGGGL